MKSLRRTLMLAGALCASLAAGAASAADNKVVIGDIDDMSGPYADVIGSAGVESIKMAIADFGGSVLGQPIEVLTFDHQNKPDSRRAETSRMGRHRRTDDAARRLQHRRQPRHVGRGQGEEGPLLRHRRGRRVADRQGLHALHDPLWLRHDSAFQRHRQNNPRRGRQELVLHHRRLRFREATGGDSQRTRQGGRRNRGRRRSGAARDIGLLLLSPPGAKLGRAGARARQRRHGHLELAQGGGGIRPDQDDEAGGAARVPLRRPRARARNRAGPRADHLVVLEHERHDAGVRQPVLRKDEEDADLPPGRLLFGDARLSQRGQGGRLDRPRQGHGATEEDEDQ